MAAGRPAGDVEVFRVRAKIGSACSDRVERSVNFRDDLGECRIGRERVADVRDTDSVCERTRSKKTECLLRAHLPVAAVYEDEHGCVAPLRGKVIDAVALPRAITDIEVLRMSG